MEHIRQTGPECYLVTTAMLAGRSIETIRKEADAIARLLGVKRGGYLYLLRGRGTCERVRRQQLWRQLEAIFTKRYGIPKFPVVVASSFAPIWNVNPETIDLAGKGTVCVMAQGWAHAMAYCGGLVYDGNASEPMTLKAWIEARKTMYHTRRITGITVRSAVISNGSFFSE